MSSVSRDCSHLEAIISTAKQVGTNQSRRFRDHCCTGRFIIANATVTVAFCSPEPLNDYSPLQIFAAGQVILGLLCELSQPDPTLLHWKAYGFSGVHYGGARHAILLEQPQIFGKVRARYVDLVDVYSIVEIACARRRTDLQSCHCLR